MEKDLISIIIPVYNVEKYLKECVSSVLNQSYKNLEIILVDDGSTDSSGKICDELIKNDKRIIVIHKKNGGLSDARNYGIDKSNGNYISFVDSDDIINKKMITDLYKAIKQYKSDISVCRFKRFKKIDELEDEKIVDKNDNYIIKTSNEYFVDTLYQKDQTLNSVSACAKLYDKKIFENLRFEKGKINEDFLIFDNLMEKCSKVALVDETYYYYRVNSNSITNSKFNIKKVDVIKHCNDLILKYKKNKEFINAIEVMKITRCFDVLANIKVSKFEDRKIINQLNAEIISNRNKLINNKYARNQIKVLVLLSYVSINFAVCILSQYKKIKFKFNIQ